MATISLPFLNHTADISVAFGSDCTTSALENVFRKNKPLMQNVLAIRDAVKNGTDVKLLNICTTDASGFSCYFRFILFNCCVSIRQPIASSKHYYTCPL